MIFELYWSDHTLKQYTIIRGCYMEAIQLKQHKFFFFIFRLQCIVKILLKGDKLQLPIYLISSL